ncbi:aldo/keto reductase [Pseudonocardia sp. TRM90224]|uniref:aldo/keto reductase n=1 Tax=Pseudonocardia sp. TRM90224 TaxID=2812678 RepID=UPI001E5C1E6E|nr:aldo/keto reductase [Pseudonocardia sp. TRM90224]
MRYRLLGRTGLRVSELVLGTMTFHDKDEARRIVDAYADAGGNVLDTASAYGESEEILGAVVRQRDRFVIGTKYTLARDRTDPNTAGNHRKNLVGSLERSLRRLRTDHVDILWVHIWDRHTPLEATMRALDDLVRAGKVLHVAVSDAPAWVVSRANTLAEWRDWTPFSAIQVPYNLLTRDAERELIPMAEALGLTVTAWAPMGGGVLAGSRNRVDPEKLTPRERAAAAAVRDLAGELGVSAAQVAIAWTRHRSAAVLPIVGVSSVEQVLDGVAAVDVVLPADAVAALEAAAPFERGFPADFIEECEQSPFVFGDAHDRIDA